MLFLKLTYVSWVSRHCGHRSAIPGVQRTHFTNIDGAITSTTAMLNSAIKVLIKNMSNPVRSLHTGKWGIIVDAMFSVQNRWPCRRWELPRCSSWWWVPSATLCIINGWKWTWFMPKQGLIIADLSTMKVSLFMLQANAHTNSHSNPDYS